MSRAVIIFLVLVIVAIAAFALYERDRANTANSAFVNSLRPTVADPITLNAQSLGGVMASRTYSDNPAGTLTLGLLP